METNSFILYYYKTRVCYIIFTATCSTTRPTAALSRTIQIGNIRENNNNCQGTIVIAPGAYIIWPIIIIIIGKILMTDFFSPLAYAHSIYSRIVLNIYSMYNITTYLSFIFSYYPTTLLYIIIIMVVYRHRRRRLKWCNDPEKRSHRASAAVQRHQLFSTYKGRK